MVEQSKTRRRWLWKQGYRKCAYCGVRLQWNGKHKLTADHEVARSIGGTNKRKNLLPACYPCNQMKGRMAVDDFRVFLAKAKEWRRILGGTNANTVHI